MGIIGVEEYNNIALLRSMVVIEKYRDKGLGSEILTQFLKHLKQQKITDLYLLTTTAQKFFEKFGFKIIDRKATPAEIQSTEEFSNLCPDTSFILTLSLAH